MMRSLYSGVSGLKVHQTKMDVIGNNISNVNTVGFRGSTVNFTDVFYQTTQNASGPNATTGTAGTNAVQIGLGSNVAAIHISQNPGRWILMQMVLYIVQQMVLLFLDGVLMRTEKSVKILYPP